MDERLKKIVYEIVSGIPPGFVLTYGHVAFLAGVPQNARLIGKLMSSAPEGLPAHRVVNHKGGTVPGWSEQTALLESEGITFKGNGCVDMTQHLWKSL